MGTFTCCKRYSEDTSSVFAPGEQEIYFKQYESRSDPYFTLVEGKYNLLINVQLLEYINLLESFSLQTATLHHDGKYRSNFSSKDEFLSTIVHQEEFQSFIENKLLNIPDILEMFGEDQEYISIFRDCFIKIFSALNVRLNSYYKTNKENKITKRSLIGFGLLFCRGQNISKVKLFFDLFKDENENFVKSDNLNDYLMTIFFISSYCLLHVRSKINMPLKNLPKIENNLAYNLLNGNGLAQKDCENLLKYFNDNFFDKESFSWDEFKTKFDYNQNNSFSWIFTTKGIRSKLENKNLFKNYNN
jgi:hypothetical protein